MNGRGRSRAPDHLRRLAGLGLVLAAGFLALTAQLVYLQILTGDRLAELSDKNRIRLRAVMAPRGILFDRNGLPLVENRPAFTLAVVPRDASEDLPAVLDRLASLLNLPVAELQERFARVSADSPWPVRLQRGLTLDEISRLEEWKLELPGVTIEAESQRAYPSARFAAHLLGYVREVSEADLARGRFRRGDLVGQSGLERLYDEHLRGRDGAEQIEVDAYGRPIRVLQRQEPVAGAHVYTTIDRRIQEAAEQALGSRNGAAIVLDPRNGDVLALVSNPAFPVERFSGPIDRETWLALVQDPDRPLLNRAIQGEYQPGSLFKIVVAAAALQSQVFTPFDRLSCPREWWFGGRAYHNWEDRDRGALNLYEALQYSCNTFFYQLGLKVGPERIARMAEEFGLGRSTGSGFVGERPGLVPSPAWKKKALRDNWYAGDTVSLSIGQGLITVTPLQVARFMAAVANGGVLWKPRMVMLVKAPDGTPLISQSEVEESRLNVAPVVFEFLHEALANVVTNGTGKGAQVPGIAIAGKTGTAQTREFKSDAERKRRDQDNAWFGSFAPVDDPRFVVVVFAEHAGLGGQVAAPIAREIYRAIFLEKVASVGGPTG
jgi:penicillin-binding protein 2